MPHSNTIRASFYAARLLFGGLLFLHLLPLTARAQPTCQITDGLSYDPRMVLILGKSYYKIVDATPQKFEFAASNAFTISIERPTQVFSAPVSIKLEQVTSGSAQYICGVSSKKMGADDKFLNFVVSGVIHPSLFSVEITDHGEGGATGDPPYTLEVKVFERDGQQPPLTISRPPVKQFADACENIPGPPRRQARLEAAGAPVTLVATEFVGIGYFRSGRYLYVAPDHTDIGSEVLVKIFGKSGSEGPYTFVCEFVLNDKSEGYFLSSITVDFPHRGLWRVEIYPLGGPPAAKEWKASIKVFRDLDFEFPDWQKKISEDATFAGAFVCQSPSRGSLSNRATGAFAQGSLFRANILDPDRQLTARARKEIVDLLLKAMALWRRSCHGCLPEHAIFIDIDGAFFTLNGALGKPVGWALVEEIAEGMPRGGEPVVPRTSDMNVRSGTRTPTQEYISIARDDPLVQSICSHVPRRGTRDLTDLKRDLQCPGVAKGHRSAASLKIIPVLNGTRCGGGKNTLACEASGLLIEFNARDYSFVTRGSKEPLFGQGTRADFFAVLLHEVGHWIGLDHSTDDNSSDIMHDSYEVARCISDSTRKALSDAVKDYEASNAEMPPRAFTYQKQRP